MPRINSTPKTHSITCFSVFRDWRLVLYNLAVIAYSPYLLFIRLRRCFLLKDIHQLALKRWTTPSLNTNEITPQKPHILFLSTGFGEKQATEKLVAALQEIYPHLCATFCVKDDNTFRAMSSSNPRTSVAFTPCDFWPAVAHWLKKYQPDVIVSLRYLWLPNIIWGARLSQIPVCVIGAPTRRYKPARSRIWAGINRWTLRGYHAIGMISQEEKENHRSLFDPQTDVRVTGPTRFLQPHTTPPPSSELSQWIGLHNKSNFPLLTAGSLHANEIDFILDAFERTRAQKPCLLLVAPRRLEHSANFQEALRHRNLNFKLRSSFAITDTNEEKTDVLILDTMGELSAAYSFAEAAFVGGTLHGTGHNIFEPLEWRVPVFFGFGKKGEPHASHIDAIDAGVGFRIKSSEELANHWIKILCDSHYHQALRDRCHLFIENQEQHFQINLQFLIDMIELKNKTQSANNAFPKSTFIQ